MKKYYDETGPALFGAEPRIRGRRRDAGIRGTGRNP